MSHGKGAVPKRKIEKILKANGFQYVRNNGHEIYRNDQGVTVAIPRTCCTPLLRREFKAKGIVWEV